MVFRAGFVFFGVALVLLGVGSDSLPVAKADCTSPFGSDVLFGAGNGPITVAIGDLDGDGDADMVVSNGSLVSVLLNDGDGTFATRVPYGAGPSPGRLPSVIWTGMGTQTWPCRTGSATASTYC